MAERERVVLLQASREHEQLVMNEVVIDRGVSPFLTSLKVR